MSESTRHTARITGTYRETALWIVWRLSAPPIWVTRMTVALVGPHIVTAWAYLSTTVPALTDDAAHAARARITGLRHQPAATYVFVVATVLVLAVFSGLVGHS